MTSQGEWNKDLGSRNHSHCCEHEVKYCKVCDVAYCVKCGKEWKYQHIWYYPYYTWTSNPTITVSTSDSTIDSSTGTYHVH